MHDLSSNKENHVVNRAIFFERKKKWRNVHVLCVRKTHATQTKQIHNILPRSSNSFCSSFARPSLLPCKLSPRADWTRPQMTDIFQVQCWETISFLFVFFCSTEILGPVCHTSKHLAALWKRMTWSPLWVWRYTVLCQHGIECWLSSHLSNLGNLTAKSQENMESQTIPTPASQVPFWFTISDTFHCWVQPLAFYECVCAVKQPNASKTFQYMQVNFPWLSPPPPCTNTHFLLRSSKGGGSECDCF